MLIDKDSPICQKKDNTAYDVKKTGKLVEQGSAPRGDSALMYRNASQHYLLDHR